MDEVIKCQGRYIRPSELLWLQKLVEDHPEWSRHQITKAICSQWDWRTQSGRLKTFAARSMIDKLEQRGHVDLPPVRVNLRRNLRPAFPNTFTPPVIHPVSEKLKGLLPLRFHVPDPCSYEDACFGYYLSHYHYLGFDRTVGQNLKLIVRDRFDRDLACLLFGSAAWQTAPRDAFIGWRPEVRSRNINLITNNTRFLILPWVQVPHLASHILGRTLRYLSIWWTKKYSHPIYMVETFVEANRFKGTCYKAANWIRVGQTKGRSRQERQNKQIVPIKDIYLYPLDRNFRQALCGAS